MLNNVGASSPPLNRLSRLSLGGITPNTRARAPASRQALVFICIAAVARELIFICIQSRGLISLRSNPLRVAMAGHSSISYFESQISAGLPVVPVVRVVRYGCESEVIN